MAPILTIPDEILYKILYYCYLVDIYKVVQCNKHLYNLIDFNYFVKLNTYNVDSREQYKYIQISQTKQLKHGSYKSFHLGKLSINEEINYEYGKRQGVYNKYNTTGVLIEHATYVNNLLHGINYVYHESGDICREIEYKNGCKDGIYKIYDYNNILHQELTYVNDKRHGVKKEYYSTSKYTNDTQCLHKETPYIDGIKQGIRIEYTRNGEIHKIIPYINDRIHGLCKLYDNWNKYLCETVECIYGLRHGRRIEYYENSKIRKEYNYIYGACDGNYKEYYRNGNIHISSTYSQDYKHRTLEEYYENGNIECQKIYTDGLLTKTTDYYRNGKPKTTNGGNNR